MPKAISHVLSVARLVRGWAVNKAKEWKMKPTLEGMCAVACVELYRRLRVDKEEVRFVVSSHPIDHGSSHVHLRVGEQIVDVTASQFGQKPVCIVPVRNQKPWYWKAGLSYEHLSEFVVEHGDSFFHLDEMEEYLESIDQSEFT